MKALEYRDSLKWFLREDPVKVHWNGQGIILSKKIYKCLMYNKPVGITYENNVLRFIGIPLYKEK